MITIPSVSVFKYLCNLHFKVWLNLKENNCVYNLAHILLLFEPSNKNTVVLGKCDEIFTYLYFLSYPKLLYAILTVIYVYMCVCD